METGYGHPMSGADLQIAYDVACLSCKLALELGYGYYTILDDNGEWRPGLYEEKYAVLRTHMRTKGIEYYSGEGNGQSEKMRLTKYKRLIEANWKRRGLLASS